MRNCIIGLFCVVAVASSLFADAMNPQQAEHVFSLQGTTVKSVSINRHFSAGNELSGSTLAINGPGAVFGVGVTAEITLSGDASLARVVLIDESNQEYLIYEISALISKGRSVSVIDACEETKLLDGIVPAFLRVELFGATCSLESIRYVPTISLPLSELMRTRKEIRAVQVERKIALLNEGIKRKGMSWTAGPTSLSSLTYAQKKSMFEKNGMLANLQGYDHYASGVFELRSNAPAATTLAPSAMVDNFDWRSRHGAALRSSPYYDGDSLGGGWVTPIRDQAYPSYCGSCWVHSTVATAEVLCNLFYNRHLDINLAEQYLMECSDGPPVRGSGCNGGYPARAAAWIVNHGVMEEACFPYQASNDPVCGDSCSSPRENLHFAGYATLSGERATEDSLKRFLIHNGPLILGVESLMHAMCLVGYRKDASGATVWIFKDSHGLSRGQNGYTSFKPSSLSDFNTIAAFTLPPSSRIYSGDSIRCVDLDKDGYYNWGIGPKPATCPDCPDEKDCDDSRPDLGPMDSDGSCKEIITDIARRVPAKERIFSICNSNPFGRIMYFDINEIKGTKVRVSIYDLQGNMVKILDPENLQNSTQRIQWDGSDATGASVKNGTYLCRVSLHSAVGISSHSFKIVISR
ncbi:MAG: hypothetical protein JW768_03260 [Chitinispirillaceae bacterium]|nr:hypothetical protein [Chitinispirillaceae bacterium]